MTKLRECKNSNPSILLLIGIVVLILSCTKIDTKGFETDFLKKDFFKIEANVNPLVIRVLENIKIRNLNTEFVTKFASDNGYPVWDKAILQIVPRTQNNSNSFASGAVGTTDTVVFIPIVLSDANAVNGFIQATCNGSINLKYKLAQNYKAYPETKPNDKGFTATKFAALIMQLDNQVFGYTRFNITDYNLIFKNTSNLPAHTKPFPIEWNEPPTTNNLISYYSGIICYTIGSGQCTCNNTNNCDMCLIDCAYQLCFNYSGEYDDGEYTPITIDGGPGTGGGGSGGEIPPSYPCTMNTNIIGSSVVPGGPLPPCSPPGPGVGWNPTTPPIPTVNPCDVYIALLKNDTYFANKFKSIANPTILGLQVEKGYLVQNRAAQNYSVMLTGYATGFGGAIGYPSPRVGISGFLHSHYSGLATMFSAKDVINLARSFLSNESSDPSNLFNGLATSSGNYLIKITDTAKFRKFANKITDNYVTGGGEKEDKFINFCKGKFNTFDNYLNEKEFLQMFNDKDMRGGMSLYRGTTDCNEWTALRLKTTISGTTVEEQPCN
jgi:hypothetical protein